ncbi:zinc finger BED domain-containing protein RICESLEEPER 2-like protein [Tanacetum coccineum]
MANQSTSTIVGAGSSSVPVVVQILPNNRNPNIWKDFNLCLMSDNTKKAQCIHCLHFFSKDSNSTLKNHITHPHCEAKKRVAESGQSSMPRDESIYVYNSDVLREQFAGLVIQRGLPFNHFDDEQTTRVFQNHWQPRYTHVSRTTLKRDAIKLWVTAKQAIIDGFLQINTNVNLTTDVWTPPHGILGSYICVTAHWIEPDTWQMMKRVIAFEDFLVPHTSSALAKTLRDVFVNFKLENKIMSITLDNASNNTSAVSKLRLKYEPPMEGRAYYPTSPLVLQQIVFMTTKLSECELEGGIFATMVKPMKEKPKKYFERMSPIITCAAALNPCFSVHGVKFLIESISLYNIYYTKYGNPTTTESSSRGGGSSSRTSGGNQRTTLLRRLKEHTNKKARSDPSLSSEYERYVHSDFVTCLQTTEFETFDVLGFWKAKETMFPVLSRMAMDILSVQATSVASESAFSTSGRVLSIRRTRLTPASLEMCMCLKDHLDAQERKQDKSTLETPVDFEEEILDAEVQANEAIPLSDEEIALDAASSEGSMSGPGSGGEEAEAEPNYGYDVYNDDY